MASLRRAMRYQHRRPSLFSVALSRSVCHGATERRHPPQQILSRRGSRVSSFSITRRRMAGKRIVWYLHDILTADHFSALNRRVAVILGNQCAGRVIANSEASRKAFIACGGDPARTTVVYNGIDAPSDPTPETEAAAGE